MPIPFCHLHTAGVYAILSDSLALDGPRLSIEKCPLADGLVKASCLQGANAVVTRPYIDVADPPRAPEPEACLFRNRLSLSL